jgi:hypothetical protein
MPDLLPGYPDVEVFSKLVGVTNNEIPVSTLLTLVAGFVNGADIPLNISGIIGTLNDPATGQSVYNLTGQAVGEVVEPGSEMSLEYRFMPPQFPSYPFELQLALSVFYEGDGMGFSNSVFNQTVLFVEASQSWESTDFLPYALAIASLAVFFYTLPDALAGTSGWAAVTGKKPSAISSSSASSSKAAAADDDEVPSILMTGSAKKTK